MMRTSIPNAINKPLALKNDLGRLLKNFFPQEDNALKKRIQAAVENYCTGLDLLNFDSERNKDKLAVLYTEIMNIKDQDKPTGSYLTICDQINLWVLMLNPSLYEAPKIPISAEEENKKSNREKLLDRMGTPKEEQEKSQAVALKFIAVTKPKQPPKIPTKPTTEEVNKLKQKIAGSKGPTAPIIKTKMPPLGSSDSSSLFSTSSNPTAKKHGGIQVLPTTPPPRKQVKK